MAHLMAKSQIRRLFDEVATWRRGSQRAPHKPLLLLYALGRLQRGENAQMLFGEVESRLRDLLVRFGPPRQVIHPEYPFCLLANDGIWRLQNPPADLGNGVQPSVTTLRNSGTTGGLPDEISRVLNRDGKLLGELALDLLRNHFPESLHEDILDAVGLAVDACAGKAAARDPLFRDRILRAYEYRCAVTGLDARLESVTIALEAAHIKWHTSGGPDTEPNGLALSTLHHKLFDLGAFSISSDDHHHRVIVSQCAVGNDMFKSVLLDLHGKLIREPVDIAYRPAQAFLKWHLSEVFRHPARPM